MALSLAASLAGAAYLNAKWSLSTDVAQLLRDRSFARRLERRLAQLGDTATLYRMLELLVDVDGRGAVDALWFEQSTWSYRQLKDRVDPLAAFLAQRGVVAGDCVAVFMTNSPEMVVTLYALSKLGAVGALINTNLRGTLP